MTEQIETKWRYVARVYRENGNTHNAEIAEKIDDMLATITEYDSVTQEWADDLESGVVGGMDIVDVVQCIDYCTACEYTTPSIGCDGCIFRERGGTWLYHTLDLSEMEERQGDE